jgi:hypothetical protein
MIPRGLPDRQANLLAFLQIRSSTTRAGYQQMAGISRGTARADLKELLRAGLIVQLGASRSARYSLPPSVEMRGHTAQDMHPRGTLAAQSQPNLDPIALAQTW